MGAVLGAERAGPCLPARRARTVGFRTLSSLSAPLSSRFWVEMTDNWKINQSSQVCYSPRLTGMSTP